MGWQVLSPFRGYANHQFTGGYDYINIVHKKFHIGNKKIYSLPSAFMIK